MTPFEGLKAVIKSCTHAWEGIDFAIKTQRNFRIQLLVGVAAVALGVLLRLNRIEFALLTLTIGLVLVAELLNTGIEFVLNLLETRSHPVVRAAKDVAAGAAMAAVLISIAMGLILFLPKLVICFRSSCLR